MHSLSMWRRFAHVCEAYLGPYHMNDSYVVELAQILVSEHAGLVPGSYPALKALPGVGHKTASVVMSQVFNVPSFAVDTHVHR